MKRRSMALSDFELQVVREGLRQLGKYLEIHDVQSAFIWLEMLKQIVGKDEEEN